MSEIISKREIVKSVGRLNLEPSPELVSRIENDAQKHPEMFRQIVDSQMRERLMKKKLLISAGIACVLLAVCICVWLAKGKNKAYADYYSLDPYIEDFNTVANLSPKVKENMRAADEMSDNFWGKLPYSGQYKPGAATGEYTVTGRRADEFPDYYCGMYFNVNGKLIVVIKESYYDKNYRESDWYTELSKMLGSEDFGCCSAKYNYTELVNGMSDLVFGSLGKAISEAGVNVVDYRTLDYANRIRISVKTEEEADVVRSIVSSDMFTVGIVEYDFVDY